MNKNPVETITDNFTEEILPEMEQAFKKGWSDGDELNKTFYNLDRYLLELIGSENLIFMSYQEFKRETISKFTISILERNRETFNQMERKLLNGIESFINQANREVSHLPNQTNHH